LRELRLRLSPQNSCGNQSNDKPDREGLDKGHRRVDERVCVQLLVFFQLLKLRLDGGGTCARSLKLFNDMGRSAFSIC
jgi:hypothetical protein